MFKVFQVFRFEVMRSLKKPTFWLAAILIPVVLVGYIAVCALIGYSAEENFLAGSSVANLHLAYVDDADYLTSNTFINEAEEEQSITKIDDIDSALKQLDNREIDIIYYIPDDFKSSEEPTVEIYTKLDKNNITDDYKAPISALLAISAKSRVKSIDADVLTNNITFNTTSYAPDGHTVDMKEMIAKIVAPAAAFIMFYLLIAVLGNRLIVAMTEEKENRISELLLVSIKPIHLILGKIISLMLLGLIQLFIIVAPVILIYIISLRNNLIPPEYIIAFDIRSLILHALLLIASYYLLTAINILIGTLVSTAKEASNFSGVTIVAMILPLMLSNVFMTGETSTLVYFLSYFPLSAPLSLMFRSIFSELPDWELLLGTLDVFITSTLLAILASRIFCRNAVNFSLKFNLKSFKKTRKKW